MDYMNEEKLRDLDERGIIELDEMNLRAKREVSDQMDFDEAGYPNYLNAVAIDPERNNLIYRVVRSEYDKGSRIVIFTKRRYHCELFKKTMASVEIDVAIFWGSRTRKDDSRMDSDLDRVRAGEVRVAIGNVLDEGLDFPTVDVGIITYRNAKNPGQLDQQAGRLARLFKGKSNSRLYYIHDGRIERFKGDITTLKNHFKTVTIRPFPKRVRKIVR